MTVLDLLNDDPRKKRGGPPLRHPEKARRPDAPVARKPDWIRVKAPGSTAWARDQRRSRRTPGLTTVCQEASCPNIGECWEKKHATFMIMGEVCTRACAFCNVATGLPAPLDPTEPGRVAEATRALGLSHVVVTSVDRDDLRRRRRRSFRETISAIRDGLPRHDDRGAHARLPAQAWRARASGRGRAGRLQP